MRYTDDPSNLILPTSATIKHIAKREGLGELTELEWDFLWDLLAKTGGAQVAKLLQFLDELPPDSNSGQQTRKALQGRCFERNG